MHPLITEYTENPLIMCKDTQRKHLVAHYQ